MTKELCGARDACRNPASPEPHGCPYQEDVNNNADFQCSCCDECRQECVWDI